MTFEARRFGRRFREMDGQGASGPAFDGRSTRSFRSKGGQARSASARRSDCSKLLDQKLPPGPGGPETNPGARARRGTDMFGKLTWGAIPLEQPIPLVRGRLRHRGGVAVLVFIALKGWIPYLWREWITSVDHKRIGVMYVLLARDAAARLHRRADDALAAGVRVPVAGLPAARALQSDFLRSRHDHDFLRRHAVHDRADEFRRASAARRARRGVSDVEFGRLLAHRTGALLVNVSLVVGEFARTGWLPFPPLSELTYSPGVGVDYYCWALQISGVGTVMTGVNFVTTILKIRAPGMTYMRMPVFCWTALAPNLLIVAAFPVLTATLAMLTARPLPRLPFLHQRGRRQHDDVHEPHLGLGPSRGLHPHPAGVRRLLRGRVDLLAQAAVRLPLDGDGDHGDLRPLVHGVAASLLHDGRRRRTSTPSSASRR